MASQRMPPGLQEKALVQLRDHHERVSPSTQDTVQYTLPRDFSITGAWESALQTDAPPPLTPVQPDGSGGDVIPTYRVRYELIRQDPDPPGDVGEPDIQYVIRLLISDHAGQNFELHRVWGFDVPGSTPRPDGSTQGGPPGGSDYELFVSPTCTTVRVTPYRLRDPASGSYSITKTAGNKDLEWVKKGDDAFEIRYYKGKQPDSWFYGLEPRIVFYSFLKLGGLAGVTIDAHTEEHRTMEDLNRFGRLMGSYTGRQASMDITADGDTRLKFVRSPLDPSPVGGSGGAGPPVGRPDAPVGGGSGDSIFLILKDLEPGYPNFGSGESEMVVKGTLSETDDFFADELGDQGRQYGIQFGPTHTASGGDPSSRGRTSLMATIPSEAQMIKDTPETLEEEELVEELVERAENPVFWVAVALIGVVLVTLIGISFFSRGYGMAFRAGVKSTKPPRPPSGRGPSTKLGK